MTDKGAFCSQERNYWLVAIFILPAFGVLGWRCTDDALPIQFWYGMAGGLVAAYFDVRYRRIPNFLTYTLAAWSVCVNGAASLIGIGDVSQAIGAVGFTDSVIGFAACFAIMFAVMCTSGVGGGDVKIAAAYGALFGFYEGILLLCFTYIFAAVGSMCHAILLFGPAKISRLFYESFIHFHFFKTRSPTSREKSEVIGMSVPLGLYFALAVPFLALDVLGLVAE